MSERISGLIRDIPNFPKAGILFRDITPLLLDPAAMVEAVEALAAPCRGLGVTKVAAIESRGFILGAPVAMALGVGLAIIRKPGKLPSLTSRMDYDLEYGTDALEIHTDSFNAGDRVAVIDDVLATGGTAAAAGKLVALTGARVAGFGFLIELTGLGGRKKLIGAPVNSVVQYG
jgi:adenine phosphoribosyltransferase